MIKGVLLGALLLFFNTSIIPQSRLTRATLRTALVASLVAAGFCGKRVYDLYKRRRGLQISGLRSFRSGPLFLDDSALKLLGGMGVSLLAAALSARGLATADGQQEKPVAVDNTSTSNLGPGLSALNEPVVETTVMSPKSEKLLSVSRGPSIGIEEIVSHISEIGVSTSAEVKESSHRMNELSLQSGAEVAIAPHERRPWSQLDLSVFSELGVEAIIVKPKSAPVLSISQASVGVASVIRYATDTAVQTDVERKEAVAATPKPAVVQSVARLSKFGDEWIKCRDQALQLMPPHKECLLEARAELLGFATNDHRAIKVLEWLNEKMDFVLKFPVRKIDDCQLWGNLMKEVWYSDSFSALRANWHSSAEEQFNNRITRLDDLQSAHSEEAWLKLNAVAIRLKDGVRFGDIKSELLEYWDIYFESESEIRPNSNSDVKAVRKHSGQEMLYAAFKGVNEILNDMIMGHNDFTDAEFIRDILQVSAKYSLCSEAT